MKVVICTGERSLHKYLCVQLARMHDVVAVLHPNEKSTWTLPLSRFRSRVRALGWSWAAINAAGKLDRWRLERRYATRQCQAFATLQAAADAYASVLKPNCHQISDLGRLRPCSYSGDFLPM